MHGRAVPFEVGALVLVAGAMLAAGCVPRPAALGTAAPTAAVTVGTATASSQPGATGSAAPIGPTPIPSFSRPTPLPAPTFLAYTVKSRDTLTSIARDFQTTPRSIAFWSRGEHPSLDPESAAYQPDRLEVGWVLLLVPGTVFDEDQLLDATPSPVPDASNGASPGAVSPGAVSSGATPSPTAG